MVRVLVCGEARAGIEQDQLQKRSQKRLSRSAGVNLKRASTISRTFARSECVLSVIWPTNT